MRGFLALFARAAVLQGCDMALRLVLLKLLTARLSTAAYGSYAFWSAVAAMGTIVFGAELFRYLQRYVREVDHDTAWLRTQLLAESALVMLTVLGTIVLGETPLASGLGIPSSSMICLVGALAWSELLIVELVRFVVLRGRGILGEGVKLARSAVTVLGIFVLPSLTLPTAILAVVAGNAVAIAMLLRAAGPWPLQPATPALLRRHLTTMGGYALAFVVPAISNQLLKVGDRFFIFGALSPDELARYSVAYNLQLLCFSATGGLASTLIYPLALRDSARNPWHGTQRWLALQVGIQAVASLLLVLVSGQLVSLVSSPAYGDAVPLVRALSPLPALMVLSGGLMMRFLANGSRWRYAAVSVTGGTVAVTSYALLVPRLGVTGAVLGTLAGYSVMALVAWLAGRTAVPTGLGPPALAK